MYRGHAMDCVGGTCGTRLDRIVDTCRDVLRSAAGDRSGDTDGAVSRGRRAVCLDARGFRAVARVPMFLGLLDGNGVLVSIGDDVLHVGGATRAWAAGDTGV